jgi:hypothetical protein
MYCKTIHGYKSNKWSDSRKLFNSTVSFKLQIIVVCEYIVSLAKIGKGPLRQTSFEQNHNF